MIRKSVIWERTYNMKDRMMRNSIWLERAYDYKEDIEEKECIMRNERMMRKGAWLGRSYNKKECIDEKERIMKKSIWEKACNEKRGTMRKSV